MKIPSRIFSRRRSGLANEQGLALLTALLAVTLLTIVVLEATEVTVVHAHFSRNTGNSIAADLLARSAVTGAEALLSESHRIYPEHTAADHPWAIPMAGLPAGEGSVSWVIRDETGKINLNALGAKGSAAEETRKVLERLFQLLGLDPGLIAGIQRWVKPLDGLDPLEIAGDRDYCQLSMPCRPRHLPILRLAELRAQRGFDDRAIALLEPFVTTLPKAATVAVNANTARPEVLTALGCELGSGFRAPAGGFGQKDLRDGNIPGCEKRTGYPLGVRGSYFQIVAGGQVGDTTRLVRTLVQWDGRRVKRLDWQLNPLSPSLAAAAEQAR